MTVKKEYGDYQTPEFFSTAVCNYLKNIRGLAPKIIIEPTCGKGSFIKSSLMFDANKIIGIDINPEYCDFCRKEINDTRVNIINSNAFTFDYKQYIKNNENLLAIGNPPWVNNSTLSNLHSNNIPIKKNFKSLKGIDALTGSSNFDICEYILLQLINSLKNTNSTIAMLCKISVAKNVFIELHRNKISFKAFDILEFNANKVFGINANACLLVIDLSKDIVNSQVCNVYSFNEPYLVKYFFGFKENKLYSNLSKITNDFSGHCCFEWRQGIKHDCAKIMELSFRDNKFINGFKNIVDIENDYIYPLIKSSMFKYPIINKFTKYVIVTQQKVKEDTTHISKDAPKTWKYLVENKHYFDKRKSSIYKGAPEFSIFGIGNYSYEEYKVGVSGFYKKPLFSLLTVNAGKPIMTDDTSYFICLPTYNTAYTAMLILNSDKVQEFLLSIAFLDAKRPFTKKVLERIDFSKILQTISANELIETERKLSLNKYFKKDFLLNFKTLVENTSE